jgi:hypothetical protein
MQPNNPYGTPAPPPQPHEYEFITNPGKPPRQPLNNLLPGGASMPMRIAVVVGGLFVLLILFLVIKGLVSGGGNTTALLNVAQQQQEIIHLSTNANQQTNLSITNQNSAVTTQASMTSAQTQLISYLGTNGHKVKSKDLEKGVSANLDQEFTTAIANNTYDSTYKQVMQSQLKNYQQALQTAYQQTSGPKGRKLLTDQFNAAKLLLQQLDTPAS